MAETTLRCPQCSALNTPDALQCWRCQSRLQAAQAVAAPVAEDPDWWRSPVAAAPARAVPAADPDLAQLAALRTRPRPRRPWMWALAVVPIVAIALIGQLRLQKNLGTATSELPTSLSGYTRVDGDTQLDRLSAAYADEIRQSGESVSVGAYRQGGKGLLVEVYTGESPELTANMALTQTADVFQRDGRTTVVTSQTVVAYEESGATVACAPLTGEVTGSLCFWTNFKHLGRVIGFQVDVRETQSLADAVRHAVDG